MRAYGGHGACAGGRKEGQARPRTALAQSTGSAVGSGSSGGRELALRRRPKPLRLALDVSDWLSLLLLLLLLLALDTLEQARRAAGRPSAMMRCTCIAPHAARRACSASGWGSRPPA